MKRLILLLVLLMPSVALAADGISPDVAFKLPFTVNGEPVLNRAVLTFTGGQAVLVVHYVKGDSIERMTYSVSREDGPSPNPDPIPVKDPIAIIIEESADRTPEQAAVMASPKVRALFGEGRFRIVDPVNAAGKVVLPSDDTKPFVQEALLMRKDWPVLFIIDNNGNYLFKGGLPETIDAMIETVEQYKEVSNVVSGTSN